MHTTNTPYIGQTVILANAADPVQEQVVTGAEFRVEDYWDTISGKSWMLCDGNFAAMHYGIRAGMTGLPLDDEVVYGKIDSLGHLVHVSELG